MMGGDFQNRQIGAWTWYWPDGSIKETGTYLPVHDLPPVRDEAAMPPEERAKIEAELRAARDRQASTAAGQNATAK